MKKRVLALLAATALVGVASAYAANPFADVPANHWAYQAVNTLADQGVVVGYPDGYFKGDRQITRYEMAQIIARAMAREDRVNAEQQAILNRLSNEFSDELNNLGVRVGKLEKKVGNVKFGGDARLKFGQRDYEVNNKKDESYGARVRLTATADLNEKTKANARFVANMKAFGNNEGSNLTFDRLNLSHDFGGVKAVAGRQGVMLGQGLYYDEVLDGVTVGTDYKGLGLEVGYGYPVYFDDGSLRMNSKTTTVYGQIGYGLKSPYGDAALKGYYAHYSSHNVYGASVDAKSHGVWIGGEYSKIDADNVKDSDAWTAGVGFGDYDQSKAGTWMVKGRYLDYGKNFWGGATTFSDAPFKKGMQNGKDFKGWNAGVAYALADGLGLKVDYYFNNKDHAGKKLDNNLVAELNYKF